jgi:hypothetical protein
VVSIHSTNFNLRLPHGLSGAFGGTAPGLSASARASLPESASLGSKNSSYIHAMLGKHDNGPEGNINDMR